MRAMIKSVGGLIGESELKEVETILEDENVVGYSIFDTDGTAVDTEGVGETAVAVFSNIFEQTEKIGSELGEASPRPSIMFTGRDMELVALPLERANVLVLKEKNSGIRREYRNAS